MENLKKINKISLIDYIIKMNLIDKFNGFIPYKIDIFVEYLDNLGINIWNYAVEDKEEIKDIENVLLVEDRYKKQRYFETYETLTF